MGSNTKQKPILNTVRQQHTSYKEVSLVNNIVYAKMFRIEESSAEATIFETY